MKRVLIAIAFLIFTFSGCKGPTGEDGLTGAQLKGEIYGSVHLLDVDGRAQYSYEGVTIQTADGTSKAVPDSNGIWTLKNVSAGVHTFTVQKEGYSKYIVSGFPFVGGGKAYCDAIMAIIKLPAFTITAVSLTGKPTDSLGQLITVDINPQAKKDETLSFRIVVGRTPEIRADIPEVLFSYNTTFTYTETGSAAFATENLIYSLKKVYGFKTGDKVYIVIYPAAGGESSNLEYTDPISMKKVTANITTPSKAITLEIP